MFYLSPMLTLIQSRRSVRSFQAKPVPEELLRQVCEAGTYAPTGHGRQSPRIVAVTRPKLIQRLSRLNADVLMEARPQLREKVPDLDPFYGAPAVLIVLADRSQPTYLYDGSLVMGNLMLAAHAVGLGSCWIHRAKQVFDSEEGKAMLREWGIEGDYEGIGHCVVGYPVADEQPQPRPRKDDYVVWVR